MTNTNENRSIASTTLKAFQKRVNTLSTERTEWETNLLATANERLYQLLGEIYTIYLQAKDGSDVDAQKYAWLLAQVQKRNIPTAKTPTFIHLITKFVFDDSGTDSRRVNSYARVLNCAAQEGVGTGNAIATFIKERGGIEEIRSALAKNTKTPAQRAFEGRKVADAGSNITVVASEELGKYAAKTTGQYVVLLGKMNAQGNVEVKHVVFEDEVGEGRIAGKTVVSGAMSNLYSTTAKANKKAAKDKAAEADAEAKNSVFDEGATSDAQDDTKQAA